MAIVTGDVLTQGLGMSARNRAGILADSTSELMALLNRMTTDLFLDAAVDNPFYIGQQETVSYNATLGGWARPARALSIAVVMATAATIPTIVPATEIVVVQPDNMIAGSLEPCVVELGGAFLPSGMAGSPTGGDLTFVYARRPLLVTLNGGTTQSLDFLIPEDMAQYFVCGVAAYLAMKDQRADEAAAFGALRDENRGYWARLLGSSTSALRRTLLPRGAATPATVPSA